MLLVPVHRRQPISVKASLVYKVNSRAVKTVTQRNPDSKKKGKRKTSAQTQR